MYNVQVNHEGMEENLFPDPSFPFYIFFEDYSALIGRTLNCHWHPELELDYVLRGGVDFTINGRPQMLTAGECLFLNSGVLHTARQREDMESALIMVVVFRPSLFAKEHPDSGFLRYFSGSEESLVWDGAGEEEVPVRLALERLAGLREGEYGYELMCLSEISRIWLYASRRMRQGGQRSGGAAHGPVKKMLAYIHDHYQEKITIDQLTAFAGVSRTQCYSQFRQYTGLSPVAYLNDYRLNRAAALMLETECSVTEAGYACGFGDSSYFVKLFRQRFGVPPMRYRRERRISERAPSVTT
ncbi:AraC family transcriptional regulator [Acutalibacter muris]|uniref:AraC family transcriptional regulator n=1 Tax=Acutalibacter muris TaxID=1796620 RepID=UPI001C3EAB95|nr:AraC family transcriptional regulator [Acutalibacter muris]MCI9543385.1 AraC family transcriptional regulator [Acutalibacter muris]